MSRAIEIMTSAKEWYLNDVDTCYKDKRVFVDVKDLKVKETYYDYRHANIIKPMVYLGPDVNGKTYYFQGLQEYQDGLQSNKIIFTPYYIQYEHVIYGVSPYATFQDAKRECDMVLEAEKAKRKAHM
jgi:hypothetical protein